MEVEVPVWYMPSFYGDVRLESVSGIDGRAETVLYAVNLTPTEEAAMEVLRRRAIAKPTRVGPIAIGREPWATEEDFRPIEKKTYREAGVEISVRLRAPIAAVQKVLARAMKPGRATVSAVKFSDGKIEEVRTADTTSATTTVALLAPKKEKPKALTAPKKETKAAVTVAAPTIGCPSPDFGEAEIRAKRVLEVFLDDQQRADFRKTGRFVSQGQDTGRRYLLSLRNAPDGGLRHQSFRSVLDLDPSDDARGLYSGPLCVHDWTVPAAEELLALHLMIVLPGRERYLRSLPEICGS
jgi:hypothetical protein